MEFKDRFISLRLANKMTQSDIASKLGVSKAIISRYEKGKARPTFENLLALADLFNTSTDYLLGRDVNKMTLKTIEDLDDIQKQLVKCTTASLIKLITK